MLESQVSRRSSLFTASVEGATMILDAWSANFWMLRLSRSTNLLKLHANSGPGLANVAVVRACYHAVHMGSMLMSVHMTSHAQGHKNQTSKIVRA